MSKKHGPEPFYRPKKNRWYVQLHGRHVNLGPDETAARARWHQLMAGVGAPPVLAASPAHGGPLVYELIDRFVGWCRQHRPGRTADWYTAHLERFLDALPDRWTLTVGQLKPFHVVDWVDAHPTWGPNHRRGAITAVQRVFAWAERMGHIGRSPVRGVDKPPARRREQVLTPAEFAGLLARVADEPFRDVLTFCWETGCRVQEVRRLEARHLRPDRGRAELPPAEAKGKRRWRFIYLTPAAAAIVGRLAGRHPAGPLFRNRAGRGWDAQAFNNRFCRLQQRLGREELARRGWRPDPGAVRELAGRLPPTRRAGGAVVAKTSAELEREALKKLTTRTAAGLGTKYALTAVRHSFATRLLEAGVDHLTVAALLGHADGTMLAKVYSHVGERTDYLRAELVRAASGRAAGGAGEG